MLVGHDAVDIAGGAGAVIGSDPDHAGDPRWPALLRGSADRRLDVTVQVEHGGGVPVRQQPDVADEAV